MRQAAPRQEAAWTSSGLRTIACDLDFGDGALGLGPMVPHGAERGWGFLADGECLMRPTWAHGNLLLANIAEEMRELWREAVRLIHLATLSVDEGDKDQYCAWAAAGP